MTLAVVEKLCLKFAVKAYRSPKFKSWFVINKPDANTRSVKTHLKQISTRTNRFENSPISYLTNLLNSHMQLDVRNGELPLKVNHSVSQ